MESGSSLEYSKRLSSTQNRACLFDVMCIAGRYSARDDFSSGEFWEVRASMCSRRAKTNPKVTEIKQS